RDICLLLPHLRGREAPTCVSAPSGSHFSPKDGASPPIGTPQACLLLSRRSVGDPPTAYDICRSVGQAASLPPAAGWQPAPRRAAVTACRLRAACAPVPP